MLILWIQCSLKHFWNFFFETWSIPEECTFFTNISQLVWNHPLSIWCLFSCWWESYCLNKQISLGLNLKLPESITFAHRDHCAITIMCPTYAISIIRGQFHTRYEWVDCIHTINTLWSYSKAWCFLYAISFDCNARYTPDI